MKNKKGFAHVVLILLVLGIIVLAVTFLSMQGKGYLTAPSPTPDATEVLPSPSPVSDSTDVETIEDELDATVTGDVEGDINSMENEAAPLY